MVPMERDRSEGGIGEIDDDLPSVMKVRPRKTSMPASVTMKEGIRRKATK